MECPDTFETIVQLLFKSIGESVPNIDDIIFASWEDDRDVWMESNSSDIVLVTIIKSEQALFGLIVPDFDLSVIASWHQMRSFMIMTEVNAVYSCLMTM